MFIVIQIALLVGIILCIIASIMDIYQKVKQNKKNKDAMNIGKMLDVAIMLALADAMKKTTEEITKTENDSKEK